MANIDPLLIKSPLPREAAPGTAYSGASAEVRTTEPVKVTGITNFQTPNLRPEGPAVTEDSIEGLKAYLNKKSGEKPLAVTQQENFEAMCIPTQQK